MAQNIFDQIIPSTTSGNQLATILNDLKDALMTGQSGIARPSQTDVGGYWIDTNTADNLIYKMYDGSRDVEIFRTNILTGKVSIGGSDSQFEIAKISDDSIGPVLKFLKARESGNGQTQENDILGSHDFYAKQDDGTEALVAQFEVRSRDNVTSSVQGSDLGFKVTKKGTNVLTEVLTFGNDGKAGFGVLTPEYKIHARNGGIVSEEFGDNLNAPVLATKKKRVANNGQVLSGDVIGSYHFKSTDQNGDEFVSAKIEAIANENHTDTAHGSTLIISTKRDGTATFQEAIKIEDGKVSILGVTQGTDYKQNLLLEDASAARQLFSIDGAVHSSFELSARLVGRDNAESRCQIYKIEGVYDSVNTEWCLRYSDSILKGADPLVNLDIPSKLVQNLVINYVNQFADLDFIDGKIHLDIRRTLA